MTIPEIPDEITTEARKLALAIYSQSVSSDDDSDTMDLDIAVPIIERALRAQQLRNRELEGREEELANMVREADASRVAQIKRAEAAERELALANGAWEGAEEYVAILRDKLAEAMDALGSPDEWADKRKELEGWTGSAWIAGEGDEDLRSECYSFLCGLFGYLRAAEDASRALMQKMEGGTDANHG